MLAVGSELRSLSAVTLAGLVSAAAVATILAALAFEHIGGYDPCPLCLQQRYAYYLGIPATIAALALLQAHPKIAAAVLVAVGIGFVVNAGLGVDQAGVEWKFWDPPPSCAAGGGPLSFDAKSINMDRMSAPCGVASWRFLGLSFAGWNAVISAGLAAGAFTSALKAIRRPG
jgi:disulfide bond formation protein DsbB